MKTIEYEIVFTGKEKAELRETDQGDVPLARDEVAGRTVVSLVSPGTEVVGSYCATHYQLADTNRARGTGYAAVFVVEEVGGDVSEVKVDDVVYGSLPHRSRQRARADDVIKIPDGLPPEKAIFCRFPKVSMPAYVHTRIRPPETAVITGLGLVGLMAAQVAAVYGYKVIAVDPDEGRRKIAALHGLQRVLSEPPLHDPSVVKKAGLGMECSGHEQAVLDLCNLLRVRGEVFLVGVPWVPRTELPAQRVLHSVFYNYITVSSGWEGEMPAKPAAHCGDHHLATALEWIAEGRIRIHDSLYAKVSPQNPQAVYQDLLHKRTDRLTMMFDWQNGIRL